MLSLGKQERLRARYKAMRPGYRPGLEVYRAALDALITPQTRLLDAGCGPGGLVKDYVGVARAVVGTDRYAAHFAEPAEIATLVEADMTALPFGAECFDVVTCSWVLEHLDAPAAAFAEVARVLSPGGHFVFITPNKANYAVWLRRLVPNRVSKPLVKAIYARDEDFINPTFYRANSYHDIDRLLVVAGLRCVRFDHVGDPTYLALNEALFRASLLLEGALDRFWPRGRVHLVGVYQKV
jgi:SAM-dependent methyltransferase